MQFTTILATPLIAASMIIVLAAPTDAGANNTDAHSEIDDLIARVVNLAEDEAVSGLNSRELQARAGWTCIFRGKKACQIKVYALAFQSSPPLC